MEMIRWKQECLFNAINAIKKFVMPQRAVVIIINKDRILLIHRFKGVRNIMFFLVAV